MAHHVRPLHALCRARSPDKQSRNGGRVNLGGTPDFRLHGFMLAFHSLAVLSFVDSSIRMLLEERHQRTCQATTAAGSEVQLMQAKSHAHTHSSFPKYSDGYSMKINANGLAAERQ
eukprot:365763-Chlamydomonas_euryale.AAC.7